MCLSVVRTTEGKCVSCGMPLARRLRGERSTKTTQLRVSPRRIEQAGLATDTVRLEPREARLEILGTFETDSRLHYHVAARVAGRVDRLATPLPGAPISPGQPIAWIWNPEAALLLRAWREGQAAYGRLAPSGASAAAIESARAALATTRARLEAMGLAPEPTAASSGHGGGGARPSAPDLPYPVEERAPAPGRLMQTHVAIGQHVAAGTDLIELVDDRSLFFVGQLTAEEAGFVSLGLPLAVKPRGQRDAIVTRTEGSASARRWSRSRGSRSGGSCPRRRAARAPLTSAAARRAPTPSRTLRESARSAA
jgi:hypothetical protein